MKSRKEDIVEIIKMCQDYNKICQDYNIECPYGNVYTVEGVISAAKQIYKMELTKEEVERLMILA